ncbi:MAG TPA: bifunctional DNA-binding transcriptional regulator/O6-methylguanine-DNA methyltransferase Ada [Dehalococcoidia bacterium]|nr:bifunctional DNA-binding transcriptional regulator/O6-methylguanine-DNA methyltransferase Ada [Dehalococcoidia bacterium]
MVAARESHRTLNEDACWEAVVQRRAASEGLFVVAVRTTKIYCRPSCPSRTPRRENVRFYAAASAAEAAGFRACKRCDPRGPARPDVALVRRISARIDAAGERAPTLAALSDEFGVSPFHLQRTFKRITGVSPRQYAAARRIQRARRSLRQASGVTAAIYDAGFGSSSRLYEQSSRALGMTPARYRRAGEGTAISYTIASCEFGRMLVAATERGIASIDFAASDGELEATLRHEFANAEIRRDDAALRAPVEAIVAGIAGKEPAQAIPLDVRATAFRIRVWDALRAIPRGETRSYSDIARAVGSPRAVRAVGSACATNPLPIVVPCHRVVREDGSLGGYRYGLDRKRTLLEREGAGAPAGATSKIKRQTAKGRR